MPPPHQRPAPIISLEQDERRNSKYCPSLLCLERFLSAKWPNAPGDRLKPDGGCGRESLKVKNQCADHSHKPLHWTRAPRTQRLPSRAVADRECALQQGITATYWTSVTPAWSSSSRKCFAVNGQALSDGGICKFANISDLT